MVAGTRSVLAGTSRKMVDGTKLSLPAIPINTDGATVERSQTVMWMPVRQRNARAQLDAELCYMLPKVLTETRRLRSTLQAI